VLPRASLAFVQGPALTSRAGLSYASGTEFHPPAAAHQTVMPSDNRRERYHPESLSNGMLTAEVGLLAVVDWATQGGQSLGRMQ
jgi:hypothetical protein